MRLVDDDGGEHAGLGLSCNHSLTARPPRKRLHTGEHEGRGHLVTSCLHPADGPRTNACCDKLGLCLREQLVAVCNDEGTTTSPADQLAEDQRLACACWQLDEAVVLGAALCLLDGFDG
jgi:hypothetical protein